MALRRLYDMQQRADMTIRDTQYIAPASPVLHRVGRAGCALALVCASWAGSWGVAQAQSSVAAAPINVLHLSASGRVEVAQDWLTMNLAATEEGQDAQAVQKALQRKVEQALKALQPQAQGKDMQVHSGAFRVSPRYGKESEITGWQGRAELIVQGRDFARIAQAAAQVPGLRVANMDFSLSHEARERVQGQAQEQAVQSFKQQAQHMAQLWGLRSYTLREVTVSGNNIHQPRVHMQMASLAMDARGKSQPESVPLEAGMAEVVVEVSGSVQMQ